MVVKKTVWSGARSVVLSETPPTPHARSAKTSPAKSSPPTAAAGMFARERNGTRLCTKYPAASASAASASEKTRSNLTVLNPSTTVNSTRVLLRPVAGRVFRPTKAAL
jgi:hypothetical protein